MTEPVLTSEDAAARHQKRVMAELRALGVDPLTVGVYGLTGQRGRTRIIVRTAEDAAKVDGLGHGWDVAVSKVAA